MMKLEALSHQGKADPTSRQVGEKLLSVTKVGKDAHESERQIQRYIRLTELLPDLSVRGLSGFVLNGLMAAHRDEKAYLVTTGYNRNMIRFSRC